MNREEITEIFLSLKTWARPKSKQEPKNPHFPALTQIYLLSFLSIMLQISTLQPTHRLQPSPKSSAFGKTTPTSHPHIHDGDRTLQQHPQHNPIEVTVTLWSHEQETDPDDGHTFPKQEIIISFVVPEFTKKAVMKAFEPHKDQFPGFYISSFNRSHQDAEF
ncbi:hypothetical protein [Crocosphaera chwakensis]|uniref:Uncharacterized protein n=1 Tax=Crocosphaera chwakensis CCY0110 TaxID=391612 RepID=A3ITX8_9CHRO|nr:hypothetical protein [Crocosphaera chwakensis]EAZ90073.1 hypothetical protein CY0110_15045 [Crocosphaera chwakensis CCY0110]